MALVSYTCLGTGIYYFLPNRDQRTLSIIYHKTGAGNIARSIFQKIIHVMDWHIGQEIVAVRAYGNLFAVGDTFTIKEIKAGPCKHARIVFDIGYECDRGFSTCNYCNAMIRNYRRALFAEALFAPLDKLADITELTDILIQPAFS